MIDHKTDAVEILGVNIKKQFQAPCQISSWPHDQNHWKFKKNIGKEILNISLITNPIRLRFGVYVYRISSSSKNCCRYRHENNRKFRISKKRNNISATTDPTACIWRKSIFKPFIKFRADNVRIRRNYKIFAPSWKLIVASTFFSFNKNIFY